MGLALKVKGALSLDSEDPSCTVRKIIAAIKTHIERETDPVKRLDEQISLARLRGETHNNSERIELI